MISVCSLWHARASVMNKKSPCRGKRLNNETDGGVYNCQGRESYLIENIRRLHDTLLQLPTDSALSASSARCPLFVHAFSNTEQHGKNKNQRMQIRKGLDSFEIPNCSQLCLHAAVSQLDRTDSLSSINGFDATSASAAFPYPAHIDPPENGLCSAHKRLFPHCFFCNWKGKRRPTGS